MKFTVALFISFLMSTSLLASEVGSTKTFANSNKDVVILSKKSIFDQAKAVMIFVEEVQADDGESKVECEKMQVFLDENQQPKRIICEERVVIRRENSLAESDRAEYFLATEMLVLTGNAQLTSTNAKGQKITHKGTKIFYDLKKNVLEVKNSNVDVKVRNRAPKKE
jgi:lipopolysaccharide transport protein LptA